MSRDDDALGGPYYAPTTLANVRAKKRELDAKVAAGEMTAAEAAQQIHDMRSLAIAHHREHGSEPKTSREGTI